MSSNLIKLQVVPNFYEGHTYLWDVAPEFIEPFPWKFTVEWAEVPYDDQTTVPGDPQWKMLSPPDMVNVFAWADRQRAVYSKDFNQQYRVRLTAGGRTLYSAPHTIFADVDRASWMYIREIQRKELLAMRALSGVPSHLFQRRQTGVPCTSCLDPSTGQAADASCPWCFGTGKLGGYHGPYPAWTKLGIQPRSKSYGQGEGETEVMTDVRKGVARYIGNPYVFSKDIIVDTSSQRRYVVDATEPELELRRIPVILNLQVSELPVQSIVYKLGTDTPLGEANCQ
jgi:hypothetical protein